MASSRIVSLIASSTEIVCALGFEPQLVGRSHECDFPVSVRQLPVCTSPKFADGTSYQIDQRIKAILQEGLSVYRVDAEALSRLRPDLIITQTQCEVCAASLEDVEEAVRAWVGTEPQIVSLAPNELADIYQGIEQVSEALGAAERGRDLVLSLKARVDEIMTRTVLSRPTVACIEWIDPLMAAGNWMPELVEMAAGENQFGQAGKHAPWMSWEQLCENDPEIIIAFPCGFDLERTRREMSALTRRRKWSSLRAVRDHRVYLADGNQYFNRPGPRVVEALEIMAEILHPEVFSCGHQGTGWQRLQ
ncbi:MAG: cobalamin-binding protein [Acidobacteriota bacterium]